MFEQLLQALTSAGLPDPGVAPTADSVTAAGVLHRFEAAVCARKHAYAAVVLQRCLDETPEYRGDLGEVSVIDPWDAAEAEVSAALTMTARGASAVIDIGHNLITRFPNVFDAFARGQLDLYRVRIIVNATRNVAEDHLKEVERRILAAALDGHAPVTGARLRAVVDKVIAQVDFEGLRTRRAAATKERHVWIGTGQDGMADVSGSLPAADAVFLSGRIGELAKGVCKQDPRTFAARRADALIALSRGDTYLACLCGRTECHAVTGQSKVARKALVHVIATRATVDGTSEQPGWLDGFGIIDADQARDIAATATIRPLLDPDSDTVARDGATAGATGPVGASGQAGTGGAPVGQTVGTPTDQMDTGQDDPVDDTASAIAAAARPSGDPPEQSAGGYRPSERQQDYVRALWGSCMFPHCDVPAWDCDIDHNKAYNHVNPADGGPTAVENLGPFCRKHHRGKTFGGWELTRHEDGTLTITSRLGMTYPVAATGPIPLLGGTELTRPDTEQVPDPKTRTRAEQHAARIRSERAHNAGDEEPPPF